jgi:YVTN family beta-propeller protein
MIMKNLLLLLFAVIILSSCSKKDEQPFYPSGTVAAGSVLVLNEGNYTFGNASVTLYNPDSGSVRQDLFTGINGRPLGDVAFSMTVYNGKAYIVVNNSAKIEVVSLPDFTSVGAINNIGSPRMILHLGGGKAYVSDIYADVIHIVNLDNYAITGTIPLSGWTDDMVEADGKVFITNYDSNRIEVIDLATDSKINSIPVTKAPVSLVKDAGGKLWALSDGGLTGPVIPALARINASSMTVEQTIPFPDAGTNPSDLTISRDGMQLYYLNYDVFRRSISDTQLPAAPYINSAGRIYYAIGISPQDEDIYLSDAIDYNQQGMVYVYDIGTTTPIDTFTAGVIPGAFWFVE